MGMRAHLTALTADEVDGISSWSDQQIFERLTGEAATAIDKSWEAAFPLVGALAGTGMMLTDNATPVGGDLSFGPAMLVGADEVAVIAGALDGVTDEMAAAQLGSIASPFMAPGLYDDEEGRSFGIWGFRETATVFETAAAEATAVLFAII